MLVRLINLNDDHCPVKRPPLALSTRGLTDRIIAGNLKGDFTLLFKAYGGSVPVERLKASWEDLTKANEKERGKVLSYRVLGTARTADRDESVVRFTCEKGQVDLTYVWDIEAEGRLLGRSVRGLTVRLRLYPSGERDFFTWDGGVRPPKPVHFEPGADGKMTLEVGTKLGTGGDKAPKTIAVRAVN